MWAAAIPAGITAATALEGLGVYPFGRPLLAAAMSRSGDPCELLRGPLVYGAAHLAAAALFWTRGPAGIVACATLCAGDGLAEMVGRRLGRYGFQLQT